MSEPASSPDGISPDRPPLKEEEQELLDLIVTEGKSILQTRFQDTKRLGINGGYQTLLDTEDQGNTNTDEVYYRLNHFTNTGLGYDIPFEGAKFNDTNKALAQAGTCEAVAIARLDGTMDKFTGKGGDAQAVEILYLANTHMGEDDVSKEIQRVHPSGDRPGNSFYFQMVIPEDLAERLSELIQDPTIGPKIMHRLIEQEIESGKYPKDLIDLFNEKNPRTRIRPPWEKWDTIRRGAGQRSKIHFSDLIAHPEDEKKSYRTAEEINPRNLIEYSYEKKRPEVQTAQAATPEQLAEITAEGNAKTAEALVEVREDLQEVTDGTESQETEVPSVPEEQTLGSATVAELLTALTERIGPLPADVYVQAKESGE